MEVAAGKVKSKPVMLEHGVADVVQWTLATAAANKLNVVRSFAHGVDSTFPLQIKAGEQDPNLLTLTYASIRLWF